MTKECTKKTRRSLYQLHWVSVIGLVWLAGLAVATASHAQTKDIKATVIAGHPVVFGWVRHLRDSFIPFVDESLEGSGVAVKWEQKYGGSLAKLGEEIEAIGRGKAQIAVLSNVFYPDELAVQNITYSTPFVEREAPLVARWVDDLQKTNGIMKSSWDRNGIQYLGGATGLRDYVLMTNFPVNSVADLKGRKIGAPYATIKWLKGTGAIGVLGNLNTYHKSLDDGEYDGVIVFAAGAVVTKLHKKLPYVSRVGFGAQYAGGLVANKEWFDSLNLQTQLVLFQAAKHTSEDYLVELNKAAKSHFQTMKSEGAVVRELDPKFTKEWAFAMDNIATDYVKKLQEKGIDGASVLKTYMDTMRRAGAKPVRQWDKELD